MARFRLGAVLRARLAQEDVAKGEVVRARQAAEQATELARRQGRRLRAQGVPVDGTGRAIAAGLIARHSLAVALAATEQLADEARVRTSEQIAALADAAKARRSVERLAERYAAARQQHELAADQRAIDELAITDRQRAAARGVAE
jgi:alkylated DNA nucleotide flippase Atl1